MPWLKSWRLLRLPRPSATAAAPCAPPCSPERQRALDLIAAIDAGGLPLNPARVNDIARRLGLEVSGAASMDDTIARLRKVLATPESS